MRTDTCDLLCLDLPKAEALRAGRIEHRVAEAAASRAKALADPTRLALAAVLMETDELCVCDLSWIVERAENLVSHHMRTLRNEGMVIARREGKMVMYSLTDEGLSFLRAALGAATPA